MLNSNTIIQFFQIISLYVAFLLPSFFIPQYNNRAYFTNGTIHIIYDGKALKSREICHWIVMIRGNMGPKLVPNDTNFFL